MLALNINVSSRFNSKGVPIPGPLLPLKEWFNIHYLDEGSPENLPILFAWEPSLVIFYRNLVSSLKDQFGA